MPELCWEHGISTASFYKWRAKYGGMDASMMSQMKSLEDENRRLRRMFADLSMQAQLLKETLKKRHAQLIPLVGREGNGDERGQHRAGLPGIWCQRGMLSLSPRRDAENENENEFMADLLEGLTKVHRT